MTMKNSAFDDFSEGVMGACYDAYDFKTCQRSDGTTYGTAGDCTQLGSKEVSKSSSKKKTSKKSSWDDSNLAAKMGSELGQVAAAKFTSGILKGFSKDSYERAANVAAKVQEMYASGQVEAGTALMRAHASGHSTMVKESLAKAGRDLDQKAASAKTRAAKENSRRQAEAKARASAPAPAPTTAASRSTGSFGPDGVRRPTQGAPNQTLGAISERELRSGRGVDPTLRSKGRQSAASYNTTADGDLLNPGQYGGSYKIRKKWNWDDHPNVERSPATTRADHAAHNRIRAWERKNMHPTSQWYFDNFDNPAQVWKHPANKGYNRPGGNFWLQ